MNSKAKSTPVLETAAAAQPDLLAEPDHDLLWRTPDGLLVVDPAGLICGTNDAATPLSGRARTALLGLEIARLDPPEGAGPTALLARLAPGSSLQGECAIATPAGEVRHVDVSAFRLGEPDGRAYLFLRDDAAHARRLAELQSANARLSAAAARADELAHAAEAANRAKSAFLASMSHELRTPLNVINGLAATLAEQSRDSTEVHSAQLILESGQNLLGIVEELIDFSGLQAGRARLEPRAFDLLGLITQIVRHTGTLARRKGLAFTYRIRPAVPARIVGDPRRLQQVLLNLLGNAVNYTQRGGVHLDISATASQGRWRLGFAVADTGVGIEPADLDKLFHPFARAEFGEARQVHGTGLGLAIAAAFAQLMGGGIAVRSRPGRGTLFRCMIEADETEGGAALATLAPAGMAGRRVLVVSSDRLTRRLLSDLFQSWGCAPVVWPGPDQPMDREQLDLPIDLAVVEAALARNLGPMINRHLQAHPPARPAPVVWLSSPDRHWPVPAAARAVNVQLPLDPAELARAAAGLLAPAGEASGAAHAPEAKLGARLPLRILAADDIPTNREMLRRLLQHLGYRAQLASNGAEAVEALRLQPFDLILLDVEMPVMNGLAAAREILRQYPDAARRPKLVALTANAQSGDRERCLAAGMDDYLAKPVLPSHLEACFQRLFGSEAAAEAPAPAVSAGPDLVDRDQLNAMFPGLPPAQVADVLQQLQASAARDLETAWPRLGKACAARDCAHLAETAHGLKGCFMMLGWSRLAAFCSDAVLQARRGTFTAWSTFGPELQKLYDLSVAEMRCFLEELQNVTAKHPGL
ncbi:MAG TPA: response regulator [Opitutaceae bacterium]|nr:response regulator [Opitutaceae bacterium]